MLLLWKQVGSKGCHALPTESLRGSRMRCFASIEDTGPETKRVQNKERGKKKKKRRKRSHSPVRIKEMKNACVMKQDSIP